MDIRPNFDQTKKAWYKKTREILLIFLIVILILLGLLFIAQVLNYTKNINLEKISTDKFSKTSNITNKSSLISRQELETKDDPYFGNPDSEVVVVEFGDFECPFCKQVFPIVREMQMEFKDQVKFIWRDMPLLDIHPSAQKAAEAGECANEQDKFWEYHDKLFINQTRLTINDLKLYAREIGLNGKQFDFCLDSGRFAKEVSEDLQTALSAGIQGTPTFFINGQKISGVIPRETFRQIINQLLKN